MVSCDSISDMLWDVNMYVRMSSSVYTHTHTGTRPLQNAFFFKERVGKYHAERSKVTYFFEPYD